MSDTTSPIDNACKAFREFRDNLLASGLEPTQEEVEAIERLKDRLIKYQKELEFLLLPD